MVASLVKRVPGGFAVLIVLARLLQAITVMQIFSLLRVITGVITVVATADRAVAQLPVTTNLTATAVETPAGPQFSIVFSDAGTGATDYLLERTPEVGAGAVWTVDDSAVITGLGGGNFRATTQRPLTFGAYRVVAYNAGGALTAQFASPTVELEEGEGAYNLFVTFSRAFTGTLNYTVEGPAGGSVGPLAGSVTVNNATTAKIVLQLGDNLTVDELSFLSLIINPGGGLGAGPNSQALITIRDNDALWDGGFVGDGLEFAFKYRRTRSGGIQQAALISDGNGLIPAGDYPAQLGASGQPFPATINLGLPASASALSLASTLSLVFEVQPGVGDDLLTEDEVQGSATLTSTYAGKAHLNSTRSGRFILQRPPPAPSTSEVELVNNP